ncbi:MAG: hypothetical protein JRJ26_01665 [Deltaproteobacteria bacterium]|nr:hypothetical protein [Deltaproteobacteria bacterium]
MSSSVQYKSTDVKRSQIQGRGGKCLPQARNLKISSFRGLHKIGLKLRDSKSERDKFVEDPVKYLEDAGISVPSELEVQLRNQAFSLETVLTGKHDPVAAIPVA